MEDVFFGLYYWLERHPTETVLVSMNYEPGTGTPNDTSLQERIYRILTSELAKEYWMQTSGNVRFSMMIKIPFCCSYPPTNFCGDILLDIHSSGRLVKLEGN